MTTVMEWRSVARAPRFEVSECGDVRFVESKRRLRGFIDSDGYLRYAIKGTDVVGAVAAHTLVAEAFLEPAPTPKHEVAHNNGSRVMNHYKNLAWKLCIENHQDRYVHGTEPAGEQNGNHVVTDEDVRTIRIEYRRIKRPGSGRSVAELDRRYGICRSQIIRIATGEAWRHIPMPTQEELSL